LKERGVGALLLEEKVENAIGEGRPQKGGLDPLEPAESVRDVVFRARNMLAEFGKQRGLILVISHQFLLSALVTVALKQGLDRVLERGNEWPNGEPMYLSLWSDGTWRFSHHDNVCALP
jgi:broad specificity phosphatase PhoE